MSILLIALIVFLAAATIQFLYFLIFIIAFSKKRQQPESRSLPVSVIVCAHDEEQNLTELIPQLLAQDYPEFEVIIVDDRSNDNTFDLLLEETKKDHRLRMVHVNRIPPHVNSKKYCITLGIKAAKFEWIVLTDADCRPENKNWIKSMGGHFDEGSTFVLGYSPYLKKAGFLNSFIRFETLITAVQYIAFALAGNPYMGVGRNLAYRKSFFLEVKGFNNLLNITGGDDDLFVNQYANKKNTSVCLGVDSLMHSKPKTGWAEFFRQKIRHLSVGKLYRFKHRFWIGIFVITWMFSWFTGIPLIVFLENPDHQLLTGGALLFRTMFVTLTVSIAGKTFGHRFEAWKVPFLDFLYSFYYLTTALITLRSKKIRWKN